MSRMIRLACTFFLLAAFCAAQQTPQKRVAVLDFDYGTVQNYVAEIYGSNQDVGKGITDLLVTKLVTDGKYSVIERKALDKILAEQDFGNSDRADNATAAKIGRMLGVDAIIVGSITKFGRDDHSKSIGGLGVGPRALAGLGVKKSEAKAVCGISARLVDTHTGQILAAINGEGMSKRSGTSLAGVGAGHGGAGAGAFDTHSSNFGQTLIGEAVMQAVNDVGGKLDDSADKMQAHKSEYSGLVADASGNTLIINVGRKKGVQVGDKVEIGRAGRVVKDPATGKVLKTVSTRIGEGTVTEVDADSATVEFAGQGPVKVGDTVKTPQ